MNFILGVILLVIFNSIGEKERRKKIKNQREEKQETFKEKKENLSDLSKEFIDFEIDENIHKNMEKMNKVRREEEIVDYDKDLLVLNPKPDGKHLNYYKVKKEHLIQQHAVEKISLFRDLDDEKRMREDLLRGVIFSEVLGEAKSRKFMK